MPHRGRFTSPRVVVLPVLLALATLAMPRVASSQARGILQVTATVVQAQTGFDGLKAANQAVLDWATNGQQVTNDVSTVAQVDRKSTRLNSSHTVISYAVFCLKKKKK